MSSIESVLTETRVFAPHETFRQAATVSGLPGYQALCDAAEQDYTGFWANLARQEISWQTPFTEVLDESNAPFYRWFADGKLNASYNCIDRHLEKRANKIALIFEADNGDVANITYRELHQRVCRFANALKKQGVGLGDRVIIYLPMSIEAIVAMQACARIGAIHSVVFGGFSAKSLHERIVDVGAKLVITADAGIRGGKQVALKASVDEALELGGCESVEKVIVYQRTGVDIAWNPHRDAWWHEVEAAENDNCEPVWVDAEHPLFILYTSGSTGTPKGVQHSTGGYLLGAIMSMKWVFDHKATDIFWCTADVGWITGHSYVAYGPLALGSTQVVFEGVPTYPDAGRFWQMIERHKVSIFYTAPTAIRSLIKLGGDLPHKYDLSSLRLLGTVGEPINPEAWMWYYKVVGKERCPIADTWWQTETGAHMIAPLPGAIDLKPGSCTRPLPGIIMDIVEEDGTHIEGTGGGLLVVKKPWPSMIRNIWGNPERFRKAYFPEELNGLYLAGDSAHRDEDGYFWIMGRIDDVLNVSGHRLGTMEIESALVANPLVAEAAIVGKPHDIKGESIVAYVVLKGERPEGEAAKTIAGQLREWVGKEIGPIAKPDEIRFGENLPKTRSGKIMRRLLRSLAKGEEITSDISTLDNPAILDQLRQSAG
ncbi:acetate--CoA ligase [Methylobacillus flagellatus]|uniref:Acetyl-coenzyme A synthetase n=1 Tax=Methylobacillus flagellatus (strain ATCC 51484 / DSM 6875 / VKM B-1610 / KT) TaxID=265072 RepID=ACSA_METFK|nr:acetate--CoA ligase [Methylobacillus flagellatus]Q1H0J2.1 RecName: Full=Acetyl-coenzyme A synthetase; Short=AcCoA synthetase; Short=Acs; AltName: Full=Acetate--CoA ligase; AltName: Full=Acyl-activating enzyme [Methylobacillus flagellatus KT]ABE49995.1 acetyl-coenzyme A synthetase [Methylobacillus flagellatus KT]